MRKTTREGVGKKVRRRVGRRADWCGERACSGKVLKGGEKGNGNEG